MSRRLTPSSLTGTKPNVISPHTLTGHDDNQARLIGICAHVVLEQWDFNRPRSEMALVIEQVCRHSVIQDYPRLKDEVSENLTVLFEGFLSSDPYRRLQRATVVGREVPFVMHLDKGHMMEGVIDLIYRLDGKIWIADYKTDIVSAEAVRARADHYRSQADNYSQAVASSLGLSSVSFQFIFLRPGVALDV